VRSHDFVRWFSSRIYHCCSSAMFVSDICLSCTNPIRSSTSPALSAYAALRREYKRPAWFRGGPDSISSIVGSFDTAADLARDISSTPRVPSGSQSPGHSRRNSAVRIECSWHLRKPPGRCYTCENIDNGISIIAWWYFRATSISFFPSRVKRVWTWIGQDRNKQSGIISVFSRDKDND